MQRVGLNERAAAISFHFLLALPAGFIFLLTLIPYLPIASQISNELIKLTQDLAPNPATYKLITGFISDFLHRPRGGLSFFGLFLVVWSASNAMLGLMRTFNQSLPQDRKRNFVENRLTALRLTTLLTLLILGTVIILITQGMLFKMLMNWLEIKNTTIRWLIKTLRWVVIVALFFYSIAFIYRYAPAVPKKWRLASPGAILATILMMLTSAIFSFWVNHFASYNKIYGSLGTVIIIMVLVFFNALVLLIGYELNVSIFALRQEADKRAKSDTNGLVQN